MTMAKRNKNIRLSHEQQALATMNMNLARDIAWKYQRRTNIEYSILESAAFEGLCQAAAKYDPELVSSRTGKSMKFSSLAVPYIRGSILHYIRDKTYSMRLTHRMREVWSKGRKFLNKGMSDIEISGLLDIDLKEWQDAKSACSGPPLELKDQATPSDPLEVDEFDNLTPFREEAKAILSRMPNAMKRRLEKFCRSRLSDAPLVVTRELSSYLDDAMLEQQAASKPGGHQGIYY
jgi:RNA polymerase sigma-B factor